MELGAQEIHIAKMQHKKMKAPCQYGLTPDEIAAINIYTQQTPLFETLNSLLRDENRKVVRPYFSYLRLFLGGLVKLPRYRGTVFRGMHGNLPEMLSAKPTKPVTLAKGTELVWWSVSSTSLDADVSFGTFAGADGARTMCRIEVKSARDIRPYSSHEEEEFVLAPGTQLRTKQVAISGEVAYVELEEEDSPYSLMDFGDFGDEAEQNETQPPQAANAPATPKSPSVVVVNPVPVRCTRLFYSESFFPPAYLCSES